MDDYVDIQLPRGAGVLESELTVNIPTFGEIRKVNRVDVADHDCGAVASFGPFGFE